MNRIIEEYKARPSLKYSNIFINEDSVITYVYFTHNDFIFVVIRKNCKNKDKFIDECKNIADIISKQNICSNKLRKFEDIIKIENFSSLILIPYKYWDNNCTISSSTLDNSIWIAPIYNCEFSGDENEKELNVMLIGVHATLKLCDWERDISPKLKMSYLNLSTLSGSRNREFQITKKENLYWAISVLKDSYSYIGFENYKQEKYIISFNNNTFIIKPLSLSNFQNENVYDIINDILCGKLKYPQYLSIPDLVNIEAIQKNTNETIKLIGNEIIKIISANYKDKDIKINKKKCTVYKNKQIIGEILYRFISLNYYENNGCSLRMELEINVYKYKVFNIASEQELNKDPFYFEYNGRNIFHFYIAHGIYKNIISIANIIILLIKKIKDLDKEINKSFDI